MDAQEKIQVLISFIILLKESIKPIRVFLDNDQGFVKTYLHSIELAGDTTLDVKEKLNAALKHLEKWNHKSNLTVRLFIGKTQDGIDEQINFLEDSFTNLKIAY